MLYIAILLPLFIASVRCARWLNGVRCHLGCGLRRCPRNHVLGGAKFSHGKGHLGGLYLCMPRFAHSQYTQLHSLAAAAVLATGVFQQVVDNDV